MRQTLLRPQAVATGLIILAAAWLPVVGRSAAIASGAEAADVKLEAGGELPRGQWTDALPYVDPSWDTVSGEWRREAGGLITEPSKMSRIMLPFEIGGDYDLEVEFTRTTGEGSVTLVIPVGRRACQVFLAGWWQTVHGLGRIDGREPNHHDNPAKFRPGRLVNDRRYRVRVSVRTVEDDAAINVSLDGKPIITWKGRQSSLSVTPYMDLPYPNRAGVGAYDSTVTYHRVALRSVAGKAIRAPHPAPPFDPGANVPWVDLLQAVDVERDAVHGRWFRREQAIAVAPASSDEGFVRLMLPEEIEGSYNLVVEFTRTKGSESVTLNLPVGTRACTLHFGSFLGGVAGLEKIDGKDIGNPHNPAVRRPGSLVNGHRYRVLVSVGVLPCPRAGEHDVVIDAWLDGKPFVRWTGPESSLGLAAWESPERRRVGLGANHCLVTFHTVRLQRIADQ